MPVVYCGCTRTRSTRKRLQTEYQRPPAILYSKTYCYFVKKSTDNEIKVWHFMHWYFIWQSTETYLNGLFDLFHFIFKTTTTTTNNSPLEAALVHLSSSRSSETPSSTVGTLSLSGLKKWNIFIRAHLHKLLFPGQRTERKFDERLKRYPKPSWLVL